MRLLTIGILAIALGACAAPLPDPTAIPTAVPTPIPTATPEPTPEPTPRTVEVRVEVVPDACREALMAADTLIVTLMQFPVDALGAYVDYPDENLAEFGVRMEGLLNSYDITQIEREWDAYTPLATDCLTP